MHLKSLASRKLRAKQYDKGLKYLCVGCYEIMKIGNTTNNQAIDCFKY